MVMSLVLPKKRQTHINAVAEKCGISPMVVDAIIKAYVDDLRDSIKDGMSIKIDRLVTIHVKETADGKGYKTASAVSKPFRHELSTILVEQGGSL